MILANSPTTTSTKNHAQHQTNFLGAGILLPVGAQYLKRKILSSQGKPFDSSFWMLTSTEIKNNVPILPSVDNSRLQVLPVTALKVALATSGPDVVELLRPENYCQDKNRFVHHVT